MANPTWPISLPSPTVEGASFVPKSNVIRTPMTAGAPKLRRRSTSTFEEVTYCIEVNRAQLQTVTDFYAITLLEVMPFDWLDPRKPADASNRAIYRFRSPPQSTPLGSDIWSVTLELDLLTSFQGTFALSDEMENVLTTDNQGITT